MELQTCKNICQRFCHLDLERQQEEYTNQFHSPCRPALSKKYNQLARSQSDRRDRNIYSFKLQEYRRYQDSDKNNLQKVKQTYFPQNKSQIKTQLTSRENASSPTITRFYSPNLREAKIQTINQLGRGNNNYEIMKPQPKFYPHPKINFHFNYPTSGKMIGKRIKTIQEQTQYSSKHSQVLFKTNFDIPETQPSIRKGKDEKNIISYQSNQSIIDIRCQSLQTISQCLLPLQQSHSPINIQQYNNGTLQSIITSTEIKSRTSSRLQNQLRLLRDGKNQSGESNFQQILQNSPRYQQNQQTQKAYYSPQQNIQKIDINPDIFYQSCKIKFSPRISVLSFSKHNPNLENDEEEELRDVIDHNFLISQQCSKNNSPKVSINPSLKNVSQYGQNSQKKQLSPFHSRENSWQLGPLMSTRAKMKRTNTIQSIESFSSEMISCLDIKFMQRNRGRRGVSRLL